MHLQGLSSQSSIITHYLLSIQIIQRWDIDGVTEVQSKRNSNSILQPKKNCLSGNRIRSSVIFSTRFKFSSFLSFIQTLRVSGRFYTFRLLFHSILNDVLAKLNTLQSALPSSYHNLLECWPCWVINYWRGSIRAHLIT